MSLISGVRGRLLLGGAAALALLVLFFPCRIIQSKQDPFQLLFRKIVIKTALVEYF